MKWKLFDGRARQPRTSVFADWRPDFAVSEREGLFTPATGFGYPGRPVNAKIQHCAKSANAAADERGHRT